MSNKNTVRPALIKGDKVSWTSTSNGSTIKKVGTITRVVEAGLTPNSWDCSEYGGGAPRDHESYVVEVSGPRGGVKQYWPRVSALRLEPAEVLPPSVA